MAIMYPGDINAIEGMTDGERTFFHFLQEAAKPDRDFFACYEPRVGITGKAPDFVLFGKTLGLLVIEVKDWTIHQIVAGNPHQFTVRISGEDQLRTNPDKQAKAYVDALMERLRAVPGLHSSKAGFQGQPKIPVGRMVAFPNIYRQEYLGWEPLSRIISPERVFFKDDLDYAGAILSDASGGVFRARLAAAFLFRCEGCGRRGSSDRVSWSSCRT